MDRLMRSLVDFVFEASFDRIPARDVTEVVRHTLDTIGCGAGGYTSHAAGVTRAVANGITGPLTASVYGEAEKVLVDYAALCNGTANRYLDFNDFGTSGHPSDMIPAILSMAEAASLSGQDVVTGVYIAYEIATRLADSVPRDGSWDQGVYCCLGVAGALSKMLGLSREQTAHAFSLALVPGIPLRVTRFGELSQWKAAAGPYSTMTAMVAVRLAANGMSGPGKPFEGKNGMFEKAWPVFELDLSCRPGGGSGIERSSLKQFGACYWTQVGVGIMHTLRAGLSPADVSAIEVDTCHTAWYMVAGGSGDSEQRWRPGTRETADHSLPFLLATMLVDGEIGEESFRADRLIDEQFLDLVARISVRERADLSLQAAPDTCPTEIRILLSDGTVLSEKQEYPRGHPRNPMTNEDVNAKFSAFAHRVLPADEAEELQSLLWQLPGLANLDRVAELLRMFRSSSACNQM